MADVLTLTEARSLLSQLDAIRKQLAAYIARQEGEAQAQAARGQPAARYTRQA